MTGQSVNPAEEAERDVADEGDREDGEQVARLRDSREMRWTGGTAIVARRWEVNGWTG
jgi:hypothetical protein